MGRINTLLWGLAAGAGLMYFLDPENGKRRQAQARDRLVSIRNSSDVALQQGMTDLENRIRGLRAETMSRFSGQQAEDWVIRERVRSRLGMLSNHPRAIEVDVIDGRAYLTGDVLQDEVDFLVSGLQKVSGIKGVENRLSVHQTAGDISALQGEGRKLGESDAMSPSTRLLATSGGILLWLIGSLRGGPLGFLMKWGGFGLGLRGISNKNLRRLAGMQTTTGEFGVVDVRKTITINAPVEEVYSLWENFENFPRFMSHVESISNLGGGRSHWVVKGPAGVKVEFDAVVTEKVPNELIAWETVSDADVRHKGRVRFTRQNDRTRAQIWMTYVPPAGALGHAVATLFGADPKSAMDEDLVRLKSLLEHGVTTAEGERVRKEEL